LRRVSSVGQDTIFLAPGTISSAISNCFPGKLCFRLRHCSYLHDYGAPPAYLFHHISTSDGIDWSRRWHVPQVRLLLAFSDATRQARTVSVVFDFKNRASERATCSCQSSRARIRSAAPHTSRRRSCLRREIGFAWRIGLEDGDETTLTWLQKADLWLTASASRSAFASFRPW
jgi:hypothetical protein